jgi:hypothetical protein
MSLASDGGADLVTQPDPDAVQPTPSQMIQPGVKCSVCLALSFGLLQKQVCWIKSFDAGRKPEPP